LDSDFFGSLPTHSQTKDDKEEELKLIDPEEEEKSSSSDGVSNDKSSNIDSVSAHSSKKKRLLKENLDRIKAQKEHQREWLYSSGFQIDET
jgi:hypothetical protein